MSGYIGNIPVPQATQTRQSFTATASQTSFPTIGYTEGFIDVHLNGVKLLAGVDFNVGGGNGSDVILATGAALNDILEVTIFDTFTTSDTVSKSSGGTFVGDVTMSGNATFEKGISVGTTTNLLSNAEFTTNTTGWAATGSTLAIVSNELQLTPASGVNGFANQQVDNLVIGASYVASVTVTVDAGSLSRLYIGTSANGNQTVNTANLGTGTHSFTFVATATTHHFALVVGGGSGQVTRFDNAKLTEASRVVFPAATGTAPEIKQGNSVNDLALSTNSINRVLVDNNGHVTMPTQPSFLVQPSSLQTNISVNSDNTIAFGTERFDVGGNFSSNTFTAPATGKYNLNVQLRLENLDTAANYYHFHIQTSNRGIPAIIAPAFSADPPYWDISISVIADMDANDTAHVTIYQSGGSAQTDISTDSFFSGILIG